MKLIMDEVSFHCAGSEVQMRKGPARHAPGEPPTSNTSETRTPRKDKEKQDAIQSCGQEQQTRGDQCCARIAHIPTLLIWGSLDTAVDPASAAQLKQHFKDCRLVMFEGAGHLPYEEVPEEFNRAVAEFLSEHDSIDASSGRC